MAVLCGMQEDTVLSTSMVSQYYNYIKTVCSHSSCVFPLQSLPKNSVVLFHACAHNPTGADPMPEQWIEMSKICKV